MNERLDLAVAGDISERVRHLVVGLPAPHQAAAVGVALHEQDAVVSKFELVVGIAVLVLAESGPLCHRVVSLPRWSFRRSRYLSDRPIVASRSAAVKV